MKLLKYTFIILIGLQSCSTSSNDSVSIQWKDSLLLPPVVNEQSNPGLAGAFSGVDGDHMIIAGGANFPEGLPWEGGKKKYHDEVYVFRFYEKKWEPQGVFHLTRPIAYGASVSVKGGVFCMGGENDAGISAACYLVSFDSAKNEVHSIVMDSLPLPLTNPAAAAHNGKIYVAGGASVNTVSNRFFVLDITSPVGKWQELTSLSKGVTNSVLASLDNHIFLIGGRCQKSDGISELYNSVYDYDIQNNRWAEKKSLPYALSAGTGMALNDHEIFVFGGDRGETFHKTELLIQQINNEKDSVKRSALVDEKNKLQKNHPGFCDQILVYDPAKNDWKTSGKIPFATPVTTNAFRYLDEIIIPSGEIKAGVRTPNILIGTIKPD